MTSGKIFDIKRYAINDGPGIRTAIFCKGCQLDCWWCHNPEGKSDQPQLMFRQNRCKSSQACVQVCPRGVITWENGSITDWENCDNCGKCAEVCYAGAREMVGRWVSISELMSEIERDVPFYDQSGGGVTFTGGEPLYQREFLKEALRACKERSIHTAVDTSGQTAWSYLKLIQPLIDLFLYDLKLMDEAKHIKYIGISNRLILSNLYRLSTLGARMIVRIPLIPGINNDEPNLISCASFLSKLPCLEGVALMPYHDIGVTKYHSLGMKYRLENIKPLSDAEITQVENLLTDYQLPVIKNFEKAI